jgi:mannosyltransferase
MCTAESMRRDAIHGDGAGHEPPRCSPSRRPQVTVPWWGDVASNSNTPNPHGLNEEPYASLMISRSRWLAVLPAVVALLMSLAGSWIPAFSRDERATLRASHLPWSDLWAFLHDHDAVHGSYYTVMHPWLAEFGASKFVARFPSAVAVAVAVGGVTAIGYSLIGQQTAVISGLVMALLPVTSHYGMEARSYALACALVTWAGYSLLRASKPRASMGWWVSYGVLLVAASAIFIYALLVGLAHTLTLGVARRSVRAQLSAFVVAGVVISPLVLVASRQGSQIAWVSRVIRGNVAVAPLSWTVAVPLPRGGFSPGTQVTTRGAALVLGALLWLLVMRAALALRRHPSDGVNLLTLTGPWLLVPAAMLITVSTVQPTFVERYVFFSMPAFALLAGYQLSRLRRRSLAIGVAVMVLLAAPLWISDREPLSKSRREVSGTLASISGFRNGSYSACEQVGAGLARQGACSR